jgi:2'-5' RNA ligase
MALSDQAGRLFFAVPLSEEVREAMVVFLNRALKGKPIPGRPVKAHNWHLTLRFLGDVDRSQYELLLSILRDQDWGNCFDIVFGGLGAFPRPSKAAVLWIGVDQGQEGLFRAAASAEKAAENAGLPPADKPFSPHLTLSRIRPPQSLASLVEIAGLFAMKMAVREVVLFRSHLSPSGPRYEPLDRFALRSAAEHRSGV